MNTDNSLQTGLDSRIASVSTELHRRAAESPQALALTAPAAELTYAELASHVDDFAGRLAALGAGVGERVAIGGLNSVGWVVAFLGALELGAIAVPLNPRLGRSELEQQLRHVEPRVVLCDDELTPVLVPAANALGAELRTLAIEDPSERSAWSVKPHSFRSGPVPSSAPALISFTSGSTGVPKGALISHGALERAARNDAAHLDTGPDDRTLVLGPLFHNTGFCDQLAHMIIAGGTTDLLPAFGTAAARRALAQQPSTFLIAVPGILRLLMLADEADDIFGQVRTACYGGSRMPEAWIRELAKRWPSLRLYNVYGLTEFTAMSHLLEPEDAVAKADTVGRPVHGVEQRVVGDDGKNLPAGEAGSVLLAGPTRMSGYWRAPELTRQALRGRWLVTGDVGAITEGGYLRLTGRKSDVINRGGEKISPLQIESALSERDEIGEAAVVGAPHPIFGERVIGFVTVRGDFDESRLQHELRDRIADYAIPERFVVVDELPRTAAGKVDRIELRRTAATLYAAEQA
jgi:long-chain acyl-CoA synthetase